MKMGNKIPISFKIIASPMLATSRLETTVSRNMFSAFRGIESCSVDLTAPSNKKYHMTCHCSIALSRAPNKGI